jgi:hypothetical protein
VISELLDAGLSRSTVLAMEGWKAQEVLDLLRRPRASASRRGEPAPGEAASPLFAPGPGDLPHATI